MRSSLVLLLGLSFLLASCNKPDIEDCRRACWNYNKLVFWAQVDEQVKDLEPAEAAKIRQQKEAEFLKIEQREEDPGLMNCIQNCQNDANREQVKCMQEAKTAARVQACLKD